MKRETLEEFDMTWITRDFPEFDEKLPQIAHSIIARSIDFLELEAKDPDLHVLNEIMSIVREHVPSLPELTGDELELILLNVAIGCNLMCCESKGIIERTEDGKYVLTQLGQTINFKD
jgi:hypothetical protein